MGRQNPQRPFLKYPICQIVGGLFWTSKLSKIKVPGSAFCRVKVDLLEVSSLALSGWGYAPFRACGSETVN
jgi:hypothetical protein